MPKFEALEYDIQQFLAGEHHWNENDIDGRTARGIITLSKNVAHHTLDIVTHKALNEPKEATDKSIRMSELGDPCIRKLYYKWYYPHYAAPPYAEEPDPMLQVKFAFGDYIEELFLFLAAEAGHKVSSRQEEVGLPVPGTDWYAIGHIDAMIDDHVVDVKSAADVSFNKYLRQGVKEETDTFGYLYQIGAYAKAIGTDKRALCFVNKHDGHIYISNQTGVSPPPVEKKIAMIGLMMDDSLRSGSPPPRLATVPDKNGEKLSVPCSYCAFKHMCYNGSVNGFISSGRPYYYTKLTEEGEKFAKDKAKILVPDAALEVREQSGGLDEEEGPPF